MLLLREFIIFDGLPLQILHRLGSEQYNVVTEAAGKVKKKYGIHIEGKGQRLNAP